MRHADRFPLSPRVRLMFSGSRVLAVIPARGGSKGIPGKNLAILGGRSLVGHAAELAHSLDWLDQVVLSTDDPEIAAEAGRWDLQVVDRPMRLATDEASNVLVWQHAWLESEGRTDSRYDLGVLLQPTSPLRTADDVTECVRLLLMEGRDAAITVSPTPGHFTPEKTMKINEDGEMTPYVRDGFVHTRQKIPRYYFLNGYCYAAQRHRVVGEGRVHGPNTGAVIIDRPVVNIDEPFDLKMAHWLWGLESSTEEAG